MIQIKYIPANMSTAKLSSAIEPQNLLTNGYNSFSSPQFLTLHVKFLRI